MFLCACKSECKRKVMLEINKFELFLFGVSGPKKFVCAVGKGSCNTGVQCYVIAG